MTTITVSSQSEAQAAYLQLAANGGGTILLAAGAEPYKVELRGDPDSGHTDPIEIRPADPNGDLKLSGLWLRDLENVTVRGVNVDTSDIPGSQTGRNFEIRDVNNVKVLDSTFKSRATEFYDRSDSVDEKGDIFGSIYNSSNFEFSGNQISDYFQGLGIFETTDIVISDNEISGIQGDGIRMAGVQRLTIEGNYLHDFHGSPNNVNHDDMIQMWSTNAKLVSRDISIVGNILNSGDGHATQSIFIGNERDGTDPTHVYENITISDNLIVNGHSNGIILSATRNGVVENNTLLWNGSAEMYSNMDAYVNGDGTNTLPSIRVVRVDSGSVTGNIAHSIRANENILGENQIASFSDQAAENYAGHYFLNDIFDGITNVEDFRLARDSDWAGFGSSHSQARTNTDEGVTAILDLSVAPDNFSHIVFDARHSIDTNGYLDGSDTFRWRFSDGTTAEGIAIEKTFAQSGEQTVELDIVRAGQVVDSLERDFNIADKTLVKVDFEDGVIDLSKYDSRFGKVNTDNLFTSGNNQAYRIGGDEKLSVYRTNDQIHNLETFGLSLDMQLSNVGQSGTFLYFHKVFQGSINSDGIVKFSVITDEGTFEISSDRPLFQDGANHTLGIGFDGVNGALELIYDGESVGRTEAYGITIGESSHDIVFGHAFSGALPAVVDNFLLHADPAEVGVHVERDGTSYIENWFTDEQGTDQGSQTGTDGQDETGSNSDSSEDQTDNESSGSQVTTLADILAYLFNFDLEQAYADAVGGRVGSFLSARDRDRASDEVSVSEDSGVLADTSLEVF